MADRLGAPLSSPLCSRLAIIGIGLIGSSMARAARKLGVAGSIVIADGAPAALERARQLKLGDVYCADAADAVRDADVVVLCVPVGAVRSVGEHIAGSLAPNAIISDVGSVKNSVDEALRATMPAHVRIVPAHPVAGTEFSGPDAGFADLFVGKWCILTPQSDVDAEAVAKIRTMWETFGSKVEIMTPAHHDLVLAITSHVPHLIAYNTVGTAAHLEEVTQSEVMKFSAGGFRDFTRIASSDPTMWRDVFLHNKSAVIEMLGRFTEDLIALQRMIRHGDGEGLFDLFTRTRAIRLGIVAQGQDAATPDFGRRGAVETPPAGPNA